MSMKKTEGKIRFFPYLPYGICSKHATGIEGITNQHSKQLVLGYDPKNLFYENTTHRINYRKNAKYLCDKGYAKEGDLSCGSPPAPHTFRQLTRLGMAILLDAPDDTMAQIQKEDPTYQDHNGKIKGCPFRIGTPTSTEIRNLLAQYAGQDNEQDRQHFDTLLLEAIKSGQATPLSYAIDKTQDCKIRSRSYSMNQLYNIWRLSHINAMFRSCNCLTYLDRRPYDTGFAIDGIVDERTFQRYVQRYGYTVPAISYYALTNWYAAHPDYYFFSQRQPDTTGRVREKWLSTPAFYATKELPIFDLKSTTGKEETEPNHQLMQSVHVGLAIGRKANYICYHAKPGPFKWSVAREQRTITAMTATVRQMKTQCPEMRGSDSVYDALYFCTSVYQFASIFASFIKTHSKKKTEGIIRYTKRPTDEPYSNLHIIPVNDSGGFLLSYLMHYTEFEMEHNICKSLIDANIGFTRFKEGIYPVCHNGEAVFLGHTMNVHKINLALTDYLNTEYIKIACFPDQVAWYRKIFPKATFV